MLGPREQFINRRLFHDLSRVHYRHAIGDFGDDAQIVCDQKNRKFARLSEMVQQLEYLRLNGDIQRRRRFISD